MELRQTQQKTQKTIQNQKQQLTPKIRHKRSQKVNVVAECFNSRRDFCSPEIFNRAVSSSSRKTCRDELEPFVRNPTDLDQIMSQVYTIFKEYKASECYQTAVKNRNKAVDIFDKWELICSRDRISNGKDYELKELCPKKVKPKPVPKPTQPSTVENSNNYNNIPEMTESVPDSNLNSGRNWVSNNYARYAIVGSVVLIMLIGLISLICCLCRKRRKSHDQLKATPNKIVEFQGSQLSSNLEDNILHRNHLYNSSINSRMPLISQPPEYILNQHRSTHFDQTNNSNLDLANSNLHRNSMNNPTLKLYLGPGSGNTANSLIADNNPEIETGFDVNNNQPYQKIYFNPWENGEQYRQLHQMLIDPSTISKITHLGGGEYGKTYRGIYTHECKHGEKIQEDVCIKILKNTEQSLEAIEECKKMFKLDHRFILPTYGLVCTKTESPMIIMPYMIYKDLEKTLQTRKNKENDFTNHQLYHFCSQIADGMAFLTFKGLTHRDLATRNCVITESDYSLKNNLKYYHVRIADLGLTQDRTDASQLNSVNTEHLGYIEENKQLKLPLKWLAPEIVKTMTFNEQTDVWAFGVTVWEILEKGETPYKGLNPGQAMQQVNEGLRLPRPVNCTDMIWNMLTTDCWNANPSLRRTFVYFRAFFKEHYPIPYDKHLDLTEIQQDLVERKRDHATLKRKTSTAVMGNPNHPSTNTSTSNHHLNNQLSNGTLRSTNNHNQSRCERKIQSKKLNKNSTTSNLPEALNFNHQRSRIKSLGEVSAMTSSSKSPGVHNLPVEPKPFRANSQDKNNSPYGVGHTFQYPAIPGSNLPSNNSNPNQQPGNTLHMNPSPTVSSQKSEPFLSNHHQNSNQNLITTTNVNRQFSHSNTLSSQQHQTQNTQAYTQTLQHQYSMGQSSSQTSHRSYNISSSNGVRKEVYQEQNSSLKTTSNNKFQTQTSQNLSQTIKSSNLMQNISYAESKLSYHDGNLLIGNLNGNGILRNKHVSIKQINSRHLSSGNNSNNL